MKVDDRALNAPALQTGRTPEAPAADRPGSGSQAHSLESAGGDRAELSGLTGRISQTLAAQSAERAQRLDKLAKEYHAGRYNPDSQPVSRAIVGQALEKKPDA